MDCFAAPLLANDDDITNRGRTMRSIAKATPFLLLPFLTGAALADSKPLPAAIAAPGETAVLTAHAVGMQNYDCKPGADGKLGWVFNSPQATLTANDKVVGHHSAGPTWELTDGSAITAKAAGNTPGTGAGDIAWLKLEVNSHKG